LGTIISAPLTRARGDGKGSHRRFVHPVTKKEVWVSVHTKKDVGRLARRILKDAGLE
jgi:predicted RNA binding protein YcfA (HicA-like mRNA interferase family)